MYKFYYHYFTDKYNKTEKPTADDVLGVVLADNTKAKVKYYDSIEQKMYDYIDPKFKFKNE